MSKMWEKLNMSSWEDILNRHRPRATSYYNPLNREPVEPVEPSHVGYYRQYYSPHPETHSVVFLLIILNFKHALKMKSKLNGFIYI